MASKLSVWFKHYTDETNPDTFMNGTGSSKAAKYKANSELSFAVIGSQNLKKLKDKVTQWLDDVGLSDNALKLKLKSLMEAKESKFMKVKGAVTEESLPVGVKVITETGLIEFGKEGEKEYSTGETIVSINVEAIETQRRSLDMAMKQKGMFEKHNRQQAVIINPPAINKPKDSGQ